jgi:hypothetical protein
MAKAEDIKKDAQQQETQIKKSEQKDKLPTLANPTIGFPESIRKGVALYCAKRTEEQGTRYSVRDLVLVDSNALDLVKQAGFLEDDAINQAREEVKNPSRGGGGGGRKKVSELEDQLEEANKRAEELAKKVEELMKAKK